MAGGTGTSSRGRGGKFKKYTRGGGKHFSRDIRPTDADGNEVSIWSVDKDEKDEDDDADDDSDSSEESSEEESSEEDSEEDGPSQAAAAQAASREDRKAQKKARKEAAIARQKGKIVEVGDLPSSDEDSDEDDDMPTNPNHSKAARKQATGFSVDEITESVVDMAAPTRREREAMEAAAAREKYLRLQAQGKTDEAQADLARLKIIREQRAAEAARRQAEREEKEEIEKKKRAEFEAKEARKKEMKKKKK